jgi:outer membrane protein assembly factor BamB
VIWRTPLFHLKPPELERVNQIAHTLLTSGAGRIYLAHDQEAVVAIDQERGDVIWITEFPSRRSADSTNHRQGWTCPLPVLFDHDRLYAVAGEANELKCLAADDGRVLWSAASNEAVRQLYGVVEQGDFQGLIVGGKSLQARDVSTGRLLWTLSSDEPALQGYGQGALTGKHVLWSTRDEYFEIESVSGRVVDRRPWGTVINQDGGGNLATADGYLVVAKSDGISVAGPPADRANPSTDFLTQQSRLPANR